MGSLTNLSRPTLGPIGYAYGKPQVHHAGGIYLTQVMRYRLNVCQRLTLMW
jgi:hypothetical protein